MILPYSSSPRGVVVSVPFPEVRNRKGTESGLIWAESLESLDIMEAGGKDKLNKCKFLDSAILQFRLLLLGTKTRVMVEVCVGGDIRKKYCFELAFPRWAGLTPAQNIVQLMSGPSLCDFVILFF